MTKLHLWSNGVVGIFTRSSVRATTSASTQGRCDGSYPTSQIVTSISVVRMPSAKASSPQH